MWMMFLLVLMSPDLSFQLARNLQFTPLLKVSSNFTINQRLLFIKNGVSAQAMNLR